MPPYTATRERLINPLGLLLVLALFAAGFVILVPNVQMLSLARQNDDSIPDTNADYLDVRVDELDLAYLKADMAARVPSGAELAAAFSSLVRGRRIEEATELLSSYPDFAPSAPDRYRLTLEGNARDQASAAPGKAAERARDTLMDGLAALADDPTLHEPGLLSRALDMAVVIDEPGVAFTLAQQLDLLDPHAAIAGLKRCANDFGFRDRHQLAVDCLDGAIALSDNASQQFDLSLEALSHAAAAGNASATDARVASHLSRLPTDAAQLEKLAERLLAVGRADVAHPILAQLAIIDPPRRVHWLTQAARWSEASGELPLAIEQLTRILAWAPDDRDARTGLARLYEWSGDPQGALASWRTVVADDERSNRPVDPAALAEVARLAELLLQPALAARALQTRLTGIRPEVADLRKLAELFERDGRPLEAARALDAFARLPAVAHTSLRLQADVYRRHHLNRESLTVWKRIARLEGRSADETLHRMELHWRLNQPQRALEVSRYLQTRTLPAETAITGYQVQLLAEIGWRYRLPWLLHHALPFLSRIEDHDWRAHVTLRIVRLLQEECRLQDAQTLAYEVWHATRDNDLALKAMELATTLQQPALFEPFSDSITFDTGLAGMPAYWNQLAIYHARQNRDDSAQAAWQQALTLAPTNADAIEGLLWLAIEARDAPALDRLLQRHSKLAAVTPSLHTAFAQAEIVLGHPAAVARWAVQGNRETVTAPPSRSCDPAVSPPAWETAGSE